MTSLPAPTEEAHRVLAELKEALAARGIILPTLALDVPSNVRFSELPLIELGRCNLATARALIEALGRDS